jgi:hypothetical protein
LIFSTTFVWNIFFYSKKNWANYDQKFMLVLVWSTRNFFFVRFFWNFNFLGRVFVKLYNIRLHENHSSGIRVVPFRQTDRHDEANIRFSQLRKRTGNDRSLIVMTIVNFRPTPEIHLNNILITSFNSQKKNTLYVNYKVPPSVVVLKWETY